MTEIEAVVGEKTYVSYEDMTKCEYTMQVLYLTVVFSAVVPDLIPVSPITMKKGWNKLKKEKQTNKRKLN